MDFIVAPQNPLIIVQVLFKPKRLLLHCCVNNCA